MHRRSSVSRCVPSVCRCALLTVRILTVAFLMLTASSAAAQSEEVEQLVAEGIELRVQGREPEALERFRKAVVLAPSSLRVQGHLALTLHAQGHWLESERVMLQVLNAPADEWVTRHLAELRGSLQAVQAHLAWLEVEASGPGEVWIDGTFIGTLPIRGPVRVAAQQCNLDLRYPGRAAVRRTIDIPAGQYLRLTLIETMTELPPRRQSSDRQTEPLKVPVSTEVASYSKTRSLGMVMLGIGASGLVAGATFGISAILARRDRDKQCEPTRGCSADGIALDARGRQWAQLADVSLIVGVAGMGIGAAMVW